MKIRTTQSGDLPALKLVLDATGLFPSNMLGGMTDNFLRGKTTEEVWLTCEHDKKAIGFCFARVEELTEGTWNMLAIAVLPKVQGTGAGSALTQELESDLRTKGNRILIADTSGTEDFRQTRAFYRKNGYVEEARIRDFWAAGDDKVTFRKVL